MKRALYRYELFCVVFPPELSVPSHGQTRPLGLFPDPRAARMRFLSRFAPWENEQLACVHARLWHALTVGFNDARPEPCRFHTDERTDTGEYLSGGLHSILKAVQTDIADDRYQLLAWEGPISISGSFLLDAFLDFNERCLFVVTDASQKVAPFYTDPNSISGAVWAWSHAMVPPTMAWQYYLVNERSFGNSRYWGYVFWSDKRLNDSKVLKREGLHS